MKNKDEIWYCEDSKGRKIPPYGGNMSNHHVPKPKKWTFDYILNRIGVLIGISLLVSILFALSSCSVTEKQAERDYELERLYLKYSFQRDSIIIEYNK